MHEIIEQGIQDDVCVCVSTFSRHTLESIYIERGIYNILTSLAESES